MSVFLFSKSCSFNQQCANDDDRDLNNNKTGARKKQYSYQLDEVNDNNALSDDLVH